MFPRKRSSRIESCRKEVFVLAVFAGFPYIFCFIRWNPVDGLRFSRPLCTLWLFPRICGLRLGSSARRRRVCTSWKLSIFLKYSNFSVVLKFFWFFKDFEFLLPCYIDTALWDVEFARSSTVFQRLHHVPLQSPQPISAYFLSPLSFITDNISFYSYFWRSHCSGFKLLLVSHVPSAQQPTRIPVFQIAGPGFHIILFQKEFHISYLF